MEPTLLMIRKVPSAVVLKTVGNISLFSNAIIDQQEVIANLPSKAAYDRIEVGIINRLEMKISKRKKIDNFFLPKNFNPKMQAI